MIAIINYGSGNIFAIYNMYKKMNIPCFIANGPDELKDFDRIILPGVGAFDETIIKLDDTGFRGILDKEVLENHKLVLGICVGMQILAEKSAEGQLPGLGWIKGHVALIDKSTLPWKPKLPHLGWNSIEVKKDSKLLEEIDFNEGFYFLHSYHFVCHDEDNKIASMNYGRDMAAIVNHENIYGVQFHPEKSHTNGIKLLHNFALL
jgi:glutamine amidotransferase